ncbi:class I glutamine amidotransferase-like protein [Podospora australis]|uniref:Class I glutamine amidotransferase-like protein n=1 Tax=Podospora australis TaxID=1536484 RepID=A0AAN6WYX4_9PEZI|nr:class I glutamine amidotransferase-like protein [Podospora australis]
MGRSITEILDVAPIDMLNSLTKSFLDPQPSGLIPAHLLSQALDIQFHWVTETGSFPTTPNHTSRITLVPTDSFATCPPLDIVLIGAHLPGYHPNPTELAFVRKAYEESSAFMTICAGIEVPLLAGLLDGKTATGPRGMLGYLRQHAPTTNWVEKRWVRDGKLWTAGALLNGTDMMGAFEHATWGGEGTLVELMCRMGGVPVRDVDYKDVSWDL